MKAATKKKLTEFYVTLERRTPSQRQEELLKSILNALVEIQDGLEGERSK